MKYLMIFVIFQFIRLICCNQFDTSANVSDINDEKHVIQKRFGFLKNLFQLSATDDSAGAKVIIDRRFRAPRRRRPQRKCFTRRRRYRRPIYSPIIGRRNFDLAFNYSPHKPRYLGFLPAFKQPPEDIYYYSFPNGLLDGNRNIDMFEPAPGDLLYPPMTPTTIAKSKFNLYPTKRKEPELYRFYEHEAINLLQTPTLSNYKNSLYHRDDQVNLNLGYQRSNDILPPNFNNHKITFVTPSSGDKNILTLSKLINDHKKTTTIYNNHQQQQNSQENILKLNLINNLKLSRGNIDIPLKGTSNPTTTTVLRRPHQSNYHHYPATKIFKNPLNSFNHDDLPVTNNNIKNVKLMITSDDQYRHGGSGGTGSTSVSKHTNKMTRNDDDDHNHYYNTYNLHNIRPHNKTLLMNDDDHIRMLYMTTDDKIGVHDDHRMRMMDQVNDERNYLKKFNIEPNYNWVNVDTKPASGDTTRSPHKYSSNIPATENPIKANSIIAERTKIY